MGDFLNFSLRVGCYFPDKKKFKCIFSDEVILLQTFKYI